MGVGKPQVTLYTSAARTSTPTAAEFHTQGAHGLHLVIDVSAVSSTPSVTPTIDGYDALSDSWYNLLTGSAITATGTTVLKIYPGITAVANASASDVTPNVCRLVATHADGDSITYSAAAHLMG